MAFSAKPRATRKSSSVKIMIDTGLSMSIEGKIPIVYYEPTGLCHRLRSGLRLCYSRHDYRARAGLEAECSSAAAWQRQHDESPQIIIMTNRARAGRAAPDIPQKHGQGSNIERVAAPSARQKYNQERHCNPRIRWFSSPSINALVCSSVMLCYRASPLGPMTRGH